MHKRNTLIWLNNINGITNKSIGNIEKYLGGIEKLWDIPLSEIDNIPNISLKAKKNLKKYKNEDFFYNILSKIEKNKVKIITSCDAEYPSTLKNIYDFPRVLYVKGNIKKTDFLSVAIVGARKATYYGKWASEKFARELAEKGITIVSGMAIGIDTYAHKGAIAGNGRTLAVLGSGVDVIYPKKNRELYNKIQENGGIISEYPLGTKPLHYNFPLRNRIISGLSLGVMVVEAKEKSGSLITVEHALEQGKDVFALPGNINSIYSQGTNKLIKEGAKLVVNINDIIEEINELKNNKELYKIDTMNISIENLSDMEKVIVENMKMGPIHADVIAYNVNLPISQVNGILTVLEMKGIIKQMPGRIFVLNI